MALILGGSNGDITHSRALQDLLAELDRMIAEQTAYLVPEQHTSLINGICSTLLDEMAWEKQTTATIEKALHDLEHAPDCTTLKEQFNSCQQIAAAYFNKRESVLSVHDFSCRCRDAVIHWAVQSVLANSGECPTPFTICALGNYGRKEVTFSSPCDLLLVYGNIEDSSESWFTSFAEELSGILEQIGLTAPFMRIDDPEWRGDVNTWKTRIAMQAGTPDPLSETVSLCDLRPVYGDSMLADELRSLAHYTLVNEPFSFLSALRSASIMPIGFNFFGRLKVEKSGSHRGEFNLVQFALMPMVITIRMLTIQKNIAETATPDRIRKLQGSGELGVDLAAKLLRAYQDFHRIKLISEVAGKGNDRDGFYLDREEISPQDESCLKQGLDALFNLQRIVYQNVES